MPTIGTTMTNQGAIQFSPAKLELLTSANYTVAGVAVDATGSVAAFRQALEAMLGVVLNGCRENPRRDHMLLRATQFSDMLPNDVVEIHGFEPVMSINPTIYDGVLKPNGG